MCARHEIGICGHPYALAQPEQVHCVDGWEGHRKGAHMSASMLFYDLHRAGNMRSMVYNGCALGCQGGIILKPFATQVRFIDVTDSQQLFF